MRVISDDLAARARDMSSGMTRDERTAVFNDRMLEDQAMNARYSDGRSVKDAIDGMVLLAGALGCKPSFKRSDKLGRDYLKMVVRRLEMKKE